MPDLPWPLPGLHGVRDRLVAGYATGRGYHDLRHLAEVLERIDELGEGDNTEVVLAAWFHDAVYEGGPDDEERSALLAGSQLQGTEVDVAEVTRLVRLTATHDPEPGDHHGEVLCDADLAILAAAPERYDEYTAGVRAEYSRLSDTDFRAGRLAVLEDLVSRDALFRTAYAREHWEPQARANLAREISELRGG